jgi:glycine/D-amino acid oxidase-like deaminating enzyme/nitrite reductase/ring-hydroxylating ferredoxin subunit
MAELSFRSSYWGETPVRSFPKLEHDLRCDVVVIGGGLTGMTTAYLLQRAGCSVVVLERGALAEGDTVHTTAHLTAVTDLRPSELVKNFGEDKARAAWDAGITAIQRIEGIVNEEQIDCRFERVPGYLHLPRSTDGGESGRQDLQRDARSLRSIGIEASFLSLVPFVRRAGIRFDGQARFHPRLYLAGLARALAAGGTRVYERSQADEIRDDPLTVISGFHRISCAYVIVATHNPIVGKASWIGATTLQTKLALYTSYVVGGMVPAGLVPDALFWDTADPYRYLRIDPRGDHDFVLLGGEDCKTGQDDRPVAAFETLERALTELVPAIQLSHRWSGQVIETHDGLPFIGEMAKRQFAMTGFAGNGMTFGTAGAMMAVDAVLGRANPWAELFDIDRHQIKGGLVDYVKENLDYPYYMLTDRLRPAETNSLDDVPAGAGRIVNVDGKLVAAFRDESGALTIRSAVCTHMGCHVRWNEAGRSWDCPCHGSRFKPTGEVIGGPAERPLERVELPAMRG